MATRWYTAYTANPKLLKILITAIGIDITTIDKERLKYYSKNGFRSLEDLWEKITLSRDELIDALSNALYKNNPKIDGNTFYEAFEQYYDIVSEQNEIIATLNELLNRICSMGISNVQEALLKAQYSNLVQNLIQQAMKLKVVDEKNTDKELEFNRMNTIIQGLANILLQLSAQDIIFLGGCNQQMDLLTYKLQQKI